MYYLVLLRIWRIWPVFSDNNISNNSTTHTLQDLLLDILFLEFLEYWRKTLLIHDCNQLHRSHLDRWSSLSHSTYYSITTRTHIQDITWKVFQKWRVFNKSPSNIPSMLAHHIQVRPALFCSWISIFILFQLHTFRKISWRTGHLIRHQGIIEIYRSRALICCLKVVLGY